MGVSAQKARGQPDPAFPTLEQAWAAAKGVICRGHGCPGDAAPYWVGRDYGGYVPPCRISCLSDNDDFCNHGAGRSIFSTTLIQGKGATSWAGYNRFAFRALRFATCLDCARNDKSDVMNKNERELWLC